MFADVRQKCFLPASLTHEQQTLVFSGTSKTKLEAEPYTVNIGGEEFRLEFVDKTKDQPNLWKFLLKATRLMKDKNDWDNLPKLLAGFRRANKHLKNPQPEQLLRYGWKAGRLDVLIECARCAAQTGFVLKERELVQLYMFFIHEEALRSGWDVEKTKQALSRCQIIVKLLEDMKHMPDVSDEYPPNRDPLVIGILLEMAAVRAAQAKNLFQFPKPDGEPQAPESLTDIEKLKMGDRVPKYAERFLASQLDTITPPAKEDAETPEKYYHACNQYLNKLIPVVHGIRVAQKVIDPKSPFTASLKLQQIRLEGMVESLRKTILGFQNIPGRESCTSIMAYNKLLGEGSA